MFSTQPKVIVVGAGAAGAMAALQAMNAGARVELFSRDLPARSGTAGERDGIAAALAGGDAVERHAQETLRMGAGLAEEAAVRAMCAAAPECIAMLERMGVIFDRTPAGTIRQLRALGSSEARLATAGRSTGQRVLSALSGQLLRAEVRGRLQPNYGWEFLSLVLDEHGICRGIVAQDRRNLETKAFPADAVILCTGGYPALFGRHCASLFSDGAAIAACAMQGAILSNPEFAQVRPFALPLAMKCRALTDTAMTEGGRPCVLREGKPWYFLEEWRLGSGQLSRDAASRALWRAVREAGVPDAAAAVDFTHLDAEHLEERLSPLLETTRDLPALDPAEAPIEVVPAVGRTMGGLLVDASHATSIPGLFAAGSAACAYHGAEVLGGNELLASLYGGRVAGEAAASAAIGLARLEEAPSTLLAEARGREEDLSLRLAAQEGSENAHAIAAELGELLFAACSVEKENKALREAAEKVAAMGERLENAKPADSGAWANAEVLFLRRIRNRVELAKAVLAASISRDESRGAHFKPAFLDRDDARWGTATRMRWQHEGWQIEGSKGGKHAGRAAEEVRPPQGQKPAEVELETPVF